MCKKCEKILSKQAIFGIDDYSLDSTKYYNEHIYFFTYEGIIRKLMLQYKFKEKSYLYKTFIKNLKKNKKMCLFLKKYDIIIPVPISKQRNKNRGYNQSLLIAKEISKELNIECIDKCLIKIKNILPQSSLKKEERIRNVKNVYSIKNTQNIFGKKILLIDDIYTTGSTVNECSRILAENGAKDIGILTIAKD